MAFYVSASIHVNFLFQSEEPIATADAAWYSSGVTLFPILQFRDGPPVVCRGKYALN